MNHTHRNDAQDNDSVEQLGMELSKALASDLIVRAQRPAARHLLDELGSVEPHSGGSRLDSVERTLMRLREDTQSLDSENSAQHVFATHFAPMCASLGFRRGLASTIDAGTWWPTCLYIEDRLSGTESDLTVFLNETVIDLADAPLEADSIRRRRPCLVSSPKTHTKTFKPLMLVSDSHGYVVAPVSSRTEIVGMVHADQFDSPTTHVDKAKVSALTGMLGLVAERASRQRRLTTFLDRVEKLVSKSTGQVPSTRFDSGFNTMRGVATMTSRQRLVLEHLAAGHTNAQIAASLAVSEATVKSHLKAIFTKMGVHSRAEAAAAYRTNPRAVR